MTYLRSIWLPRAVAAVALLTGAAMPAKADVLLDDFSNPNPAVSYSISSTSPAPFSNSTNLGTSALLGVTVNRTASVNVTDGLTTFPTTGFVGVDSNLGAGFAIFTPGGTTAVGDLKYTFGSAANFTTSGVDSLSLNFKSADLNVPYSFVLTDANGTKAIVTGLETASSGQGAGTYTTSLSAFVANNPAIDLTKITEFDIEVNGKSGSLSPAPSADFQLGSVSIVQSANPVPAPPAVLLAAAALPALGLRRVLRKKA